MVQACATAALDRRLDPASRAPIAVALSGGGDSIALLRLISTWAKRCGRPVLAITVDHRLHPDSAAWTRFACVEAQALGCAWRGMSWAGPKPATGLPAAARTARHALLAEAAREAGARVILTGHTADDVIEGELMRARDAPTLGRLREWSPSPAWPEGRGVFLLRPLLQLGRAALRAWLAAQGAGWLEDPANDDARFARARARARAGALGGGGLEPPIEGRDPEPAPRGSPQASLGMNSGGGRFLDEAGVLRLPRSALTPPVLSVALLCAAGTARPPRGADLARLLARIEAGERFTAALAGARIEATGEGVLITREVGERARGGRAPLALAPLALTPARAAVWDGRFEALAHAPGLTLVALAGYAARLPPAERARLVPLSPAARAALPAVLHPDGAVRLPAPFGGAPVSVRSLALDRFEAALGGVADERALAARDRASRPHGAAQGLTLS